MRSIRLNIQRPLQQNIVQQPVQQNNLQQPIQQNNLQQPIQATRTMSKQMKGQTREQESN
jgi:hypothetical protein